MFKFNSIASGLTFVMMCVSFVNTFGLGTLFIYSSIMNNEIQNEEYRRNFERNVDSKLVSDTQIALSLVEKVHARQQAGLLTEEEAKKEAADLVRSMRYEYGEGYFWIDTFDGDNVVLLGGEEEGKNRLELTDGEGRKIVREFIEKGRVAGGGFTVSTYPKPGLNEPRPKRNYTVAFEPYRWVIGTGVWVDAVNRQLANRQAEQDAQIRSSMAGGLFALAALQTVCIFFAVFIGHKLAKPFNFLTERLEAMGNNDLSMTDENRARMEKILSRSDELGTMAKAMNDMHDKLSEYQKVMVGMAHKDMLTGLANRRHLQEYMENIDKSSQITLISLDLDHFKEVNDNYGHQTGDAALLVFAEVMRACFPEALNVRMGGDEFMVVIVRPIDLIDVKMQLQVFIEHLLSIYRMDHELAGLTVSAGVAYSPSEPVPMDVLAQQSDIALYAAKLAGRNCYRIYHEGMENHPGMEKREVKDVSDFQRK